MSRRNRLIYNGAIYHIYQRGNNKEFIFEDDNMKSFILHTLEKYQRKLDYEVLAYVIMNNHYHLLLRANESPIGDIMFYLNNPLGKYVNGKLNRTGHVFEGRYKCKLVENDAYLIWLLRYIHRNPVKANICSDVDDYKWTSHYFYKNQIKSYINTEFILSKLGESMEAAVKRYLMLVSSPGNDNDNDRDYNITKETFNLKELPNLNGSSDAPKYNRKNLDDMITEFNIPSNILFDIKKGSKKQFLTPIKLTIIKNALEECYSIKEIAEYLNAAPSTISKLISRN
jgi:putative transposase